jgi:hypothetical protein
MTWAIAASSLFGTGALISDTRVVFSDGSSAELLQKAYPVGNYVAAAFAGSVRIGFQLIESLESMMAIPDGAGSYTWDPRYVASTWGPVAKQMFDAAPLEEKRRNSQILLIGPSPIENMGAPEIPRIEIARFSSPDFTPTFARRGLALRHIGSGSRVSEYKRAIRPLFRITSGIHRAHMAGINEWARQLAFSVTITVRDYPYHGISEHFHVIAIRLGTMAVYTNDMVTHPLDGPPVELRMPPVARSWPDFESMAHALRSGASSATC